LRWGSWRGQESAILFGTLRGLFAILGSVNEPGVVQGRYLGVSELEQVRQLLTAHPDWSRFRLSRQLATLWDWRNPVGQLKDMAARTLLLKLEQRGWIRLPPRRCPPVPRMVSKKLAPAEPRLTTPPTVRAPLSALRPLTITEVSTPPGVAQRRLFEQLLQQYHYLSHRSWVGENLQFLVQDRQGRPVACVLFGAPAWQCADRDRYIGWDASSRARHLPLVTNNTRFLIPPWAPVRELASHALSQIAHRLSSDWQAKYGHPIYLLETFVQRDCFLGTAYQAANWVRVGQTKGRSRQDQANGAHQRVPIKDIYLLPLHRQFRQRLGAPASTP
jgi:hypothetical protein